MLQNTESATGIVPVFQTVHGTVPFEFTNLMLLISYGTVKYLFYTVYYLLICLALAQFLKIKLSVFIVFKFSMKGRVIQKYLKCWNIL